MEQDCQIHNGACIVETGRAKKDSRGCALTDVHVSPVHQNVLSEESIIKGVSYFLKDNK